MFNKSKKTKKRKLDKKLHFIIFQTSDKPINVSLSKNLVFGGAWSALIIFVAVSLFSFFTFKTNKELEEKLANTESELNIVKSQNENLNIDNELLAENLDEKTTEASEAKNEIENLIDTIDDIKEVVGLPEEEEVETEDTGEVSYENMMFASASRSNFMPREFDTANELNTAQTEQTNFQEVNSLLEDTKEEVELLQAEAEKRKQYLEDAPILVPTIGTYTSLFGPRWGDFHRGVDIASAMGTNVWASGNGVVVEAEYHASYGYYIYIEHNNGFHSKYAHLSEMFVGVGDEVSQGDIIGLMGSTGISSGPHLHYEIHVNGIYIDPLTIDDYLEYKR